MTEEAAEMAEQEEQMRQEQGLRDLQAQQEVEEARQRAMEPGMVEGEEGEGERDLDAEIPDADAEEDLSDSEEGAGDGVTFNEESMVEGSRVEMDQEQYAYMEEAELTGAARDEEELGVEMERDLDDSVPEAGSYQHTDTEVEDSDSESELQNSFADVPSTRRSTRSSGRRTEQAQVSGGVFGGLQERMRAQTAAGGGDAGLARSPGNLNLSSSLLESSFVESSPVMQRGGRGRGGGNARRRGGRPS